MRGVASTTARSLIKVDLAAVRPAVAGSWTNMKDEASMKKPRRSS